MSRRLYCLVLVVSAVALILPFVIADEECNEEQWNSCRKDIFALREQYDVGELLYDGLDGFCRAVEINGSCWESIPLLCKENYPQLSTDFASYFVNYHLFCNENTNNVNLHRNVSECAANHTTAMEKCFSLIGAKEVNETDATQLQLSNACEKALSLFYCISDISKLQCGEEGEIFGKTYEESIRKAFASTCLTNETTTKPPITPGAH